MTAALPFVSMGELSLRRIQDRPARDAIRQACRDAQDAPVFIKRADGTIAGAIVTEGQAREAAWRSMVRTGSDTKGGHHEGMHAS